MPAIEARRASRYPIIWACVATVSATGSLHAQEAGLTEEAAIERALAREGIASRDAAERAVSAAEVEVIGPLDNPSLELSRESVSSESEWQLRVVQPIDLSGQRGVLRSAARAETRAVENDIARRRQLLVGETRLAFVGCAAQSANIAIHERHLAELQEAERISEARAKAGDTAVYDVRRVRVELRGAEAQLAQARAERAADCASLASLTGVSEPTVAPAAMTALTTVSATPDRPDLVAREQRLVAASQRVRAAEKARLPQIEVGAGIKRLSDDSGTAYGPVISLGATLPIWSGGGAAVRRERARRSALEAELVIAQRRVEAEQQAAAARASALRESAVAAAGAREDAARLGTIAKTAYQAGEIGVVELLDAYEAARDAELAVIAQAHAAARAAVDYDLATGRTY